MQPVRRVILLFISLSLSLGLACSLTGQQEAPTSVPAMQGPQVSISQPAPGTVFKVGEPITVQAQAVDSGSGVTQVELLVNNAIVDRQTSQNPGGESSLSVLLDYTPPGPVTNLVLTVRAMRGNVQGQPASVTVSVLSADTAPTATPAAGNTGAVQVQPSATIYNPQCRARVDINTLNFRYGPGTNYDIIGAFYLGDELPIVGRLNNNTWWEVTGNSRRGWISAAYTTTLGNCGSIPVSIPPASPTPQPDPTFTDAPQQATTDPLPPNLIISTLSGNQSIIFEGGAVVSTYIVRVKNIGGSSTGAFNITLKYPDGSYRDHTVAVLAAGEEVTVENVSATFTSPGTYRFEVLADSSGNIAESNENDNRAYLDIVVAEPTPTVEAGN